MQWGVKIPMRDGVTLNATLYIPRDSKDPQPAVFTLTPYIGDTYLDRAFSFAGHGYVYALVDVRGRGNSGGVVGKPPRWEKICRIRTRSLPFCAKAGQ